MEKNRTGGEYTFHKHEAVGAEMAAAVLKRLAVLPKRDRDEVVFLVENHMKAHNLKDLSRPKLAKLLRNRSADKLMKLQRADVLGKLPFVSEQISENERIAEDFQLEDRVLEDLGVNARLLLDLGQLPGPALGAKLRQMQALLDKNPELSREYLLNSVGLMREDKENG